VVEAAVNLPATEAEAAIEAVVEVQIVANHEDASQTLHGAVEIVLLDPEIQTILLFQQSHLSTQVVLSPSSSSRINRLAIKLLVSWWTY
jgi:hypothetical protein